MWDLKIEGCKLYKYAKTFVSDSTLSDPEFPKILQGIIVSEEHRCGIALIIAYLQMEESDHRSHLRKEAALMLYKAAAEALDFWYHIKLEKISDLGEMWSPSRATFIRILWQNFHTFAAAGV